MTSCTAPDSGVPGFIATALKYSIIEATRPVYLVAFEVMELIDQQAKVR